MLVIILHVVRRDRHPRVVSILSNKCKDLGADARARVVRGNAAVNKVETQLYNRVVVDQLAAKNPVAADEAAKVRPAIQGLLAVVELCNKGVVADGGFLREQVSRMSR